MDLGIDDAGQDREARRVEDFARRGLGQVADEGDLAVDHPDIRHAPPRMVRHLAATDDPVIGLGHGAASFLSLRHPRA